nr:MAG TPA: hypothetical protein [Caudoviricetes sp.]
MFLTGKEADLNLCSFLSYLQNTTSNQDSIL